MSGKINIKVLLFTILFFILVINMLLLYQRKLYGNIHSDYEVEYSNVQMENRALEMLFFDQLDRKPIDDILPCSEFEKIKIGFDKNKLVFMFSTKNCSSCIENELVSIRDFSTRIGPDNILLISSGYGMRELERLRSIFELQDIRLITMPMDSLENRNQIIYEAPVYFVLDTGGYANMIFKPRPQYSFISEKYLKNIVNVFFSRK